VDAFDPSNVLSTTNLDVFVRGLPGALDTTFATQGIRTPIFGNLDQTKPIDMVLASDDRILVGGACNSPPSNYYFDGSTCLGRIAAHGRWYL
jgi:hypothetical protein